MGILQPPSVLPGQVGVIGAIKYMVTTDNLATITAAGYMNNVDLGVYPLAASDVLAVTYSYVISSGTGTFAFFTVSITNGVITLAATATAGGVLLPVVSGDVAVFNGTTGQIKDSGAALTNPAQTLVVTSPGGLTTNHIAQIADANGSIKDGGVLGTAAAKAASNAALSTLASSAGSGFTIGHVVTAADTAGTIQDGGVLGTAAAKAASNGALSTVASTAGSGFTIGNLLKAADTAGTIADAGGALHAGTTAAYAGGGTSNAFVTTNMLATSIVTATILAQSNAASIVKAVPGTNTLTVTFSADPGAATTVSWISITPAVA